MNLINTKRELGRTYGWGKDKVNSLIAKGMPKIEVDGLPLMFNKESIDQWLAECEIKEAPADAVAIAKEMARRWR